MEQLKTQQGQLPTVELLEAICDAFNRHDLDGVMSFFADDGAFDKPAGPDIWGERHSGREAVRAEFAALFEAIPDLRWESTANWVSGDKGCSEWRRSGTAKSGERQDWMGCDLFTFRDGKIIKKDSYFKIVK
jgi:ketosteroid isomerase-like protein